MSQQRTVAEIYRGAPFHWVGDGFRVSNYFPSGRNLGRRISPFILMDYHPPYTYAPTTNARRGVGPHPHRGFETVTLAFEGSVAHHDSAGNSGVIGPGDVQWMTAASGILHREYHEEGFARAGGPMHMMQLWVNLPRRHKMDPPRYQGITAGDIPAIPLTGGGTLHLVAGTHGALTGPAKTFSPVHLSHARLPAGATLELAFPAAHNAAILVMSGELAVGGQAARALDLVSFANDGEVLRATATTEAHVLVLGGQPLDEPVVQYGPFVMSTEAEIRQAILDFQAGRFGELPA